MTRQTTQPLKRLPINAGNYQLSTLVDLMNRGRIDLSPPYQRGDTWTTDQRVALIYSWLTGAPVPSVTISDRSNGSWRDTDTYNIENTAVGIWAVIDGKQRLTTAALWADSQFPVPASWFPADNIIETVDTEDGPYVYYSGLTQIGRARSTDRVVIPIGLGEFTNVREEAAIYVLLNGGGTPQTADDMANAERVARS
jgi:hypothetical protein